MQTLDLTPLIVARRRQPSPNRWLWVLGLVIVTLAAASSARGQDLHVNPDLRTDQIHVAQDRQAPCAPEVTLRRAELEHEHQPGIWFHRDVARCILRDLATLERYRLLVRDLELRINASDALVDIVTEAGRVADEAREHAEEALQAAVRGRREAEEARDAWHRSRALWFAVGVVVSVAAGVGLAYIVD